jgi:hypothetical protein
MPHPGESIPGWFFLVIASRAKQSVIAKRCSAVFFVIAKRYSAEAIRRDMEKLLLVFGVKPDCFDGSAAGYSSPPYSAAVSQ